MGGYVYGELQPELFLGLAAVVQQQFEIAAQIAGYGLMPIIEPEVTITIADKAEAEDIKKKLEAAGAKVELK